MLRRTLAACLLLAASTPASAQNLDRLRTALDALPATVLSSPVPDVAYFIDMQAFRALPELPAGTPERDRFQRLALLDTMRPTQALSNSLPANWEARAGLGLGEVQYFAGFGRVPDTVALWGMDDAAQAKALIEKLAELGFTPTDTTGVIGNGEPNRVDMTAADPRNPWRSGVGAATFAAETGSVVVQGATPKAVAGVVGEQASLADNPIVGASLAGLEQGAGDGWIIEAMVISPMFGLGAPNLNGGSLSRDPTEMRQRAEAVVADASKGLPPYVNGLIANVQLDGPALAVSLAYPDCEVAKLAADQMAKRWAERMPAEVQGQLSTTTAAAGELCAAVMVVETGTSPASANPPYQALLKDFQQRRVGVLQIGQS
jgi:hypothetical protein